MKIALFDPYGGKFTTDIREWWQANGYEVRWDRYYDPELVWWADIVWFDTCDNNLLSATDPDAALLENGADKQPWSLHDIDMSNKKVIVRPIDIEVWQGHHAHDNMWNVVDDVIFLAPHIQKMFMEDSRPQQGDFKQHIIPCGVNLDRFTFKDRSDGFKIGVVAERWVSKGTDLILQIAYKLKEIDPRYHIYWLGKDNDYLWEREYMKDFIGHNQLPITLEEEFVEDLDQWWENKNYVLHCGKKETYTYAVAEAMAKGIKPIFHRYFGADATWPDITWSSIDEAVDMITEMKYDSTFYRQYLIDHNLTLGQMMESISVVLTT